MPVILAADLRGSMHTPDSSIAYQMTGANQWLGRRPGAENHLRHASHACPMLTREGPGGVLLSAPLISALETPPPFVGETRPGGLRFRRPARGYRVAHRDGAWNRKCSKTI